MSIRSQKALQFEMERHEGKAWVTNTRRCRKLLRFTKGVGHLRVVVVHLLLRYGHVWVVFQMRTNPVDCVINLGTGTQRVLGLTQGVCEGRRRIGSRFNIPTVVVTLTKLIMWLERRSYLSQGSRQAYAGTKVVFQVVEEWKSSPESQRFVSWRCHWGRNEKQDLVHKVVKECKALEFFLNRWKDGSSTTINTGTG